MKKGENMNWKIFITTFTSIFFAEIADKTQLVGLGISAKSNKPIMYCLGLFLPTLL